MQGLTNKLIYSTNTTTSSKILHFVFKKSPIRINNHVDVLVAPNILHSRKMSLHDSVELQQSSSQHDEPMIT